MGNIYLDSNTVTRPFAASMDAWLPFLSAPHHMGQELFLPFTTQKEHLLQLLGASHQDRFHLFSSNREAIHHLYQAHYLDTIRSSGQNHLLLCQEEETPFWQAAKRLERLGCCGKVMPLNAQGQVTKELLQQAISPRVSLLSLSWANGLTGVIHPLGELVEVCREKGVKIHVDVSYGMGSLYFRFADLGVDFLSFEGSLVHAPQGTAGLVVKKGEIPSLEEQMEEVNVGGLCALAAAVAQKMEMFDHLCLETARLRDRLERGILREVPHAIVLFQDVERLAHCTCISFPGVVNEALLYLLHRQGVYASMGGGRFQRLSSVLKGVGVAEEIAQGALSFALSVETTEKEVDEAVQKIAGVVHKLQKIGANISEEEG